MTDLEYAIHGDLLYSAFQPIVDLSTKVTFGYEALARCKDTRVFSNPGILFDAALKENKVGILGRHLRKKSIVKCCPLNEFLFMNIHPKELDEQWLVRPDDAIFWHNNTVYLEITESMPLSHYEQHMAVLNEIRDKGVKLAIDDFGAGYSNIKYISDLNPDIVKIDRNLITLLDQNKFQHKLVTELVNLCVEMNAKVVAEGIETKDELNAVIDTGAHFGQGFLLARPSFPPPISVWPSEEMR